MQRGSLSGPLRKGREWARGGQCGSGDTGQRVRHNAPVCLMVPVEPPFCTAIRDALPMTERRFHRARLLLFECLKKPGASRPALHSDEAEAFLAASRAAFLRAVNCARATALLRAESRLSLHGVAEAHPTHGGVWARLMLPTTRLLFCAEVLAGAAGPAPRPSCSRRGSRAQRSECALRGCLGEPSSAVSSPALKCAVGLR